MQYFGRLRCCCWIDKRSSWNLSLWGLASQYHACILKGYFRMPTWVSTLPKATPPSRQALLTALLLWHLPIGCGSGGWRGTGLEVGTEFMSLALAAKLSQRTEKSKRGLQSLDICPNIFMTLVWPKNFSIYCACVCECVCVSNYVWVFYMCLCLCVDVFHVQMSPQG